MLAWLLYSQRQEFDYNQLISHFGDLSAITLSDFAIDNLQRLLTLVVVIILGIVGGIHFIMKHYEDKFRVRQLYYSFIYLALYTFASSSLRSSTYCCGYSSLPSARSSAISSP